MSRADLPRDLVSLAFVFLVLGVKHGFDADHLAAVDAPTRYKRPISCSASDFPLIIPDRWMKDFTEAGFKPEVMPLILKENAKRLLKL